jgi:hypothetical protein
VEIEFKDIEFGFADASTEAHVRPDLLINAFYHSEIADKMWSDRYFLLLGLKGAGKSAVAWRLKLEASSDPQKFAKILELQDFPFGQFAKVQVEMSDRKARYVESWKFFLYVNLLYVVIQDQALDKSSVPRIDHLLRGLADIGVLPSDNLTAMVTKSKRKKFKAGVSKHVNVGVENESELIPAQQSTLIQQLESALTSLRSESEFRIIVDGLDDYLSDDGHTFDILGALVHAVKRINEVLSSSPLDAKVILLVRSDLYERLSDSNLNKWKRDYAIKMEWYDETGSPSESRLFQLVNLRATLSAGQQVKVAERWLPASVDGQDVEKYLLDLTRHRPRDVIQLFNELKGCYDSGKLSVEQVREAETVYSREYLLDEMKDELKGLLDRDLAKKAFELIFSLRKTKFDFEKVCIAASADRFGFDSEGVSRILERLFNCGAIGLVDSKTGFSHTTFKYRNPAAVFSSDTAYIIHRGLRKAANLW